MNIVKEFIFYQFDEIIAGCRVLDLFAGTGNLGIEALSRSADSVTFVDNSKHSLKIVEANIRAVHRSNQSTLVQDDVLHYAGSYAETQMPFTLIFADPPFQYTNFGALCEAVADSPILERGGYFVLEYWNAFLHTLPDLSLTNLKTKSFGGNTVTIFQKP